MSMIGFVHCPIHSVTPLLPASCNILHVFCTRKNRSHLSQLFRRICTRRLLLPWNSNGPPLPPLPHGSQALYFSSTTKENTTMAEVNTSLLGIPRTRPNLGFTSVRSSFYISHHQPVSFLLIFATDHVEIRDIFIWFLPNFLPSGSPQEFFV